MKKILLASTALVASAGFAAADITVGGDGYFGVGYGTTETKNEDGTTAFDDGVFARSNVNGGDAEASDYGFIYDLDIDFTATGETDSGLVFGASTDLDDNASGSQGARGFEGEIFVSGAFGTLTMGDIDGGAEVVVGDLSGVGVSGLGDLNESFYLIGAGNPECEDNAKDPTFNNDGTLDEEGEDATRNECGTGPVARYDYSVAGATLSIGLNDDEGYALGVGYAGEFANGGYSVGLGYESIQEGTTIEFFDGEAFDLGDLDGSIVTNSFFTSESADQIIAQGGVTFGGFGVKAVYGQANFDETNFDQIDQYGLSADYSFDAVSLSAFYRRIDVTGAGGNEDTESDFYGVGASYDLGGGLALAGGIAQFEIEGQGQEEETTTVADFGLAFTF